MANIPLKTIKFPGLDDTYTVPQIDSSFTGVAGEVPDSNKVKGEISSLKEDLNDTETNINNNVQYLETVLEITKNDIHAQVTMSKTTSAYNYCKGVTLKAGVTYNIEFTIPQAYDREIYVLLKDSNDNTLRLKALPVGQTSVVIENYTQSTTTQGNYLRSSIYAPNSQVLSVTPVTITGTITSNETSTSVIESIQTDIDLIGSPLTPVNKCSGAWDVDGYLSSNAFNAANGYKSTKPVYLKAGNYLYNILYNTFGGGALVVWMCDEQGNRVSTITGTRTNENAFGGNTEIIAFTLPVDSYVRTNMGNSTSYVTYVLAEGSTAADFPNEYVPYDPTKYQLDETIKLTPTMKAEVEAISSSVNSLYGKKIAADGDSICYGNGYLGGYAKMISDMFSMQYQNLAVGGGTITAETYYNGTPRHWICRSVQNLDANADYVLIEGGVNDGSLQVPLGTLSSGFTSSLDDTTFYGALETICKVLCTRFIGKKYAFVIPHGSDPGMYNGAYHTAVIECCEKWGIPVIDITKYAPPFNQFRYTDEYNTIRNTYTTDGDGWHPTEVCYREYYVPKITGVLSEL